MALAVFFGRSTARKGRFGAIDWLVVGIAALLVGIVKAPVVLILAGVAFLGAIQARDMPAKSPDDLK